MVLKPPRKCDMKSKMSDITAPTDSHFSDLGSGLSTGTFKASQVIQDPAKAECDYVMPSPNE